MRRPGEATATLLFLLAVAVVVAIILALAGKTTKIDTHCATHIGDGCVPGKPLRIEDR